MPKLSPDQTEARRLQVLSAALRCFARRGYDATTLQQIAGEAGLAVGTFYLYFEDKRAALEAIMKLNSDSTRAFLEPFLSLENSAAAIEQIFERSFDLVSTEDGQEGLQLDLQLWAMAVRDPELGPWMKEVVELWQAALARLMTRAQRSETIPKHLSPTQTARALFALLNGFLAFEALENRSLRQRKASRRHLLETVRRILGTET